MMFRSLLPLIAIVGCSSSTSTGPTNDTKSGSASADVAPVDVVSGVKPIAPPEASAPPPAKPAEPAPITKLPPGQDFDSDAQLLFRVAACAGQSDDIPEELGGGDPKQLAKVTAIVARHCKQIRDQLGKFRAAYFEKHRAWFERVVPKEHQTVVYPFGGGDLISALVAFPDATEITTISLEQAGDPRRLRTLAPGQIEASLGALRTEIGGLIQVGSNTSANLSAQQRNELPGQVSSFLLGLVAGGFEPFHMRFFKIDDAGKLVYFERADIEALDERSESKGGGDPTGSARGAGVLPRGEGAKHAEAKKKGKGGMRLKGDWESPNFTEAFQNVEIEYRRPGEQVVRTHRHIGWNLNDEYVKKHPGLLRYLEQKGKVVMLTKGASYLLWRGDFSLMRTYMLEHLTWMLSDSTGIPPTYAKRAGMVQETYGSFSGAFLEGPQGNQTDEAFIELWKKNPHKPLPFRFGYLDKAGAPHLVVTKPR